MRFIFLVYDHTDGEALTRRMSVRQKHLEEALPDKRSGFIVSGGAILDSHEVSAAPTMDSEILAKANTDALFFSRLQTKNMLGSSMVFDANSEKEVWDRIHRDIYCTAKVWNMDNCQLIPIIDGFKGLV
jgi:hypothetical protein